MPEKCSVVGCKSGYVNGPTSTRFRFPPPSFHELRVKWILFLNRPDYEITANSRICADHFEAQYVKVNETRNRLVPFNQNPIPTIHVLHPGNKKQSVPLALAIFEETTACAFRLYLPEDNTTPGFLDLIHTWWLIVNSKEPYHPRHQRKCTNLR